MKIAILIKEGNAARLLDGIRLVLGLTINHRVTLLFTDKGANAVSLAMKDETFKNKFLESMELISKMSAIIKTEEAIAGNDAIEIVSRDELTEFLFNADSIIVF